MMTKATSMSPFKFVPQFHQNPRYETEEASRDKVAYDYVEDSVHDLMVWTDLFRVFEMFKVFINNCIVRSLSSSAHSWIVSVHIFQYRPAHSRTSAGKFFLRLGLDMEFRRRGSV